MWAFLHPARTYFTHLVTARDRHAVHSPFIFDLVEKALRPQRHVPGFEDVESLRTNLLRDHTRIPVVDLGAGSRSGLGDQRSIAEIARTSLKPRSQAHMLHRIARWAGAEYLLEVGTSLGLTSVYLARAAPTGHLYTLEGVPAIHQLACAHFKAMHQVNITAVRGDFNDSLPAVLDRMDRLDLAFLDGHHTYAATLNYFEQCVQKAHNDTLLILDDIHWSPGMEAAWKAVQTHPAVRVTVDLYKMGLVFLRREQQRQHFRLRY